MTVLDGVACETVGDSVVLAVNVPHRPRVPTLGKALPQVVAILEEDAEMSTVAAPFAIDAIDHEHGIQLEDQERVCRVTYSPA